MKEFIVTNADFQDCLKIEELYRKVAAVEGGLARTADEINAEYVANFVTKSIKTGIIIVARKDEKIIGEIHGYALGPQVFAHVLGELTIAVHPDFQGVGVGRAIFFEFMRRVVEDRADILRVELIARESNGKAIEFYKKLGFEVEGKMTNRIRGVSGGFEADIPMAWHRAI
ncbi:MAG TPA: GNAT family N-acetyltransferase [Pyrinomonadaceae bacterium]|nr:GNAT family N-acetyltransferase [Pyrinomonadaceae bacterium]